jgi:hypothetical protein
MSTQLVVFTVFTLVARAAFAQCNAGPVTISTPTTIRGSCTITGDLTILAGGALNVDLTGATDTFVVQGNIVLRGDAAMWIHGTSGSKGAKFIISNSFNGQRSITLNDSSRLKLEYLEVRTQEGDLAHAASVYMNWDLRDHSILYVDGCRLTTETAWVLCGLNGHSTFIGYEPKNVPTEIYVQDTVQLALHGPNTETGLWLTLQSISDTLTLPPDQSRPYSWSIGRGVGGLHTQWYLELDTAKAGLGVQILPTARVTINGSGSPTRKELTVALLFSNSVDTVRNLTVGLQNRFVANGRTGGVTLHNVNLGPIAWQLYAMIHDTLHITNSVVNEIGIVGPSVVTVDSCLLQLAVLASIGVQGSAMTIANSEIWNQYITASNNSTIQLNNCSVTGSVFQTTDAQSRITVNGGCFFANPAGCTQGSCLDFATGKPRCNPFIPAGFPQILTPATTTLNGVRTDCASAVTPPSARIDQWDIFPQPASDMLHVHSSNDQSTGFRIFNALGVVVKDIPAGQVAQFSVADLSSGIYFLRAKSSPNHTEMFIKP